MGGKGGEDGCVHCLFNEQVPKTLIMHHFVYGADAHDAENLRQEQESFEGRTKKKNPTVSQLRGRGEK